MIKEFEEVRQWKKIRGIGADNGMSLDKRLQSQFQRVQQEVSEIHEAIVLEDWDEFIDAIGDSIVTLINIADIKGLNAEDCLAKAFDVISLDFRGHGKSSGLYTFTDKEPKDLKTVIYSRQVSNSQMDSIIQSAKSTSTEIVKIPINVLFNILNL